MKKKVSKSRTPTVLILILTIALGAVAIYVAYTIYKARLVTPEQKEAKVCCICTWTYIPKEGLIETTFASRGTLETDGQCHMNTNNVPESDFEVCQNVEMTYGTWESDMRSADCKPYCVSSYDNLINPQAESPSGSVIFTTVFELRNATPPNDRYTAVEMYFDYPEGSDAPDPILANLDESGSSDNEAISIQLDEFEEDNNTIKRYTVTFTTTWETVLTAGADGNYNVQFRAKDTTEGNNAWTEPTNECTIAYSIKGETTPGNYCNNLDITSEGTISPLDVTLNAGVSIPSTSSPVFQWKLDLNCDGTIDESIEGENAEVFVTTGSGSEDEQITKTFTLPAGTTEEECETSVNVFLSNTDLQDNTPVPERTRNACSGSVSLRQASAECGNGTCDTGETCDPNGNIDCRTTGGITLPAGMTCRNDCTFCGDAVLDTNEDCDPGIGTGKDGFNVNCQSDCTIGQTEQTELANVTVSVTSTEDCVELVAPNNTIDITITVANQDETSDVIRAVSDTLPQGFTYNTGSSTVNGTPNPTDTGIVVETSGESQLITWNYSEAGWTVAGNGGTLVIVFTATAGPETLMGSQTNTITVTPSDQNPIPGQNEFLVAQVCTQPDTGVFDNNVYLILIGSALLLVAGAAYYTGFGSSKFAILLSGISGILSSLSETKDDLILMVSKPQKYMEKRIEISALKKIKHHINEKKDKKGQKK